MIVVLLYTSADSRLWWRDAQPEQITVFATVFRKALKWWSSVALFVRDITSACFCRISQHQQVYLSTIEYQRASLRILPIKHYNLPFMRPKIPYLSSLLVTCHQSSRLYGVILKAIKSHLKGQMINRILHSWSFHIKFIKFAKGSYNKFHMKWSLV